VVIPSDGYGAVVAVRGQRARLVAVWKGVVSRGARGAIAVGIIEIRGAGRTGGTRKGVETIACAPRIAVSYHSARCPCRAVRRHSARQVALRVRVVAAHALPAIRRGIIRERASSAIGACPLVAAAARTARLRVTGDACRVPTAVRRHRARQVALRVVHITHSTRPAILLRIVFRFAELTRRPTPLICAAAHTSAVRIPRDTDGVIAVAVLLESTDAVAVRVLFVPRCAGGAVRGRVEPRRARGAVRQWIPSVEAIACAVPLEAAPPQRTPTAVRRVAKPPAVGVPPVPRHTRAAVVRRVVIWSTHRTGSADPVVAADALASHDVIAHNFGGVPAAITCCSAREKALRITGVAPSARTAVTRRRKISGT
jgi:hypothetical protein